MQRPNALKLASQEGAGTTIGPPPDTWVGWLQNGPEGPWQGTRGFLLCLKEELCKRSGHL